MPCYAARRSAMPPRLLTVMAAAILLLVARRASAQLTFAFDPSLSIGYTDNANASPNDPVGSGFGTVSAIGRLEYHGLTSEYALGYRFAVTRYFSNAGINTTSQEVNAAATFHLTPDLGLRFTAGGALGRTSALTVVSSTIATPQAAMPGSSRFTTANAGEELTFDPHPQWRLTQGLTASTVKYRDVVPEPPRNSTLGGLVRVEHPIGLETPSLELSVTDFLLTGGAPGRVPATPFHIIMTVAEAGWGHEWNPILSSNLQAGLCTMTPSVGGTTYVPAGRAAVSYRRLTWFATLSVEQQPLPNLFTGQASINDTLLANVTLPLEPREQWVVAGTAALAYARMPDLQGDLHHVYDLYTVTGLVSYRFVRAPLYLSLLYSLVDQRAAGTGLDLFRQTITLNLTGSFLWGPGTPPLFGGGGL
jgi:hypothetical protein